MIGKKIPNPKKSASKATRISRLVSYVLSPEDSRGDEKCIASGANGFLSNSDAGIAAEMIALAQSCKQSSDPIEHYVVSWRPGEVPTGEQAKDAVEIITKEMGLDGLQVVWALHSDTENMHLHVVVNRIDPITEHARRINNGFDVDALHAAVAVIEHKQGWQVEANKRFAVLEDGTVARVDRGSVRQQKQKARDAELRTGEKSALRVAQERAAPILKAAQTWQQLHEHLAGIGMRYEKKGSGAVIIVGDDVVKASDVSRSFALSQMQKKLGTYEPPRAGLRVAAAPREPVNDIAKELGWSEYAQARAKHVSDRKAAKADLDDRIKQMRDEQYKAHAAERRKALAGDWRGRGQALNALRSIVAARQAKERAELKDRIDTLRKQFVRRHPALFPTFEEWLRQQRGPDAAERYRHSEQIAEIRGPDTKPAARDIRDYEPVVAGDAIRYVGRDGRVDFIDKGPRIEFLDRSDDAVLAGLQLAQMRYGKQLTLFGSDDFKRQAIRIAVANNITIANPELRDQVEAERQRQRSEAMEKAKSEAARQFERYHSAVHADSYRVSSRNEKTGQTWAMGKQSDGSIPGHAPDAMPWSMIEQLRSKGTEHLYLTPLSRSHHMILIDDTSPEKIQRMRDAGIRVAYVQQSSPNSYQAIVKIPRLKRVERPDLASKERDIEYLASVELAQQLNREYGDPHLSNAIQPHRFPGTPNVKEKHRLPNGTFPTVTAIEASGDVWDDGVDRIRSLMLDIEKRQQQSVSVSAHAQDRSSAPATQPQDTRAQKWMRALYDAHKREIEQRVLKGRATDLSALDSMIATRLRATGHSQKEVAQIIEACTERSAGRRHNWSDYAARTAARAFGFDGTRDIERLQRYQIAWANAETRALQQAGLAEPTITRKERERSRGYGMSR